MLLPVIRTIQHKFSKGSWSDTLRVFRVIDHRNRPVWHFIRNLNRKDCSGIDRFFHKFRREEADSEIMFNCRKNQIRSGKLDCGSKSKAFGGKVLIDKNSCNRILCETDPVRQTTAFYPADRGTFDRRSEYLYRNVPRVIPMDLATHPEWRRS